MGGGGGVHTGAEDIIALRVGGAVGAHDGGVHGTGGDLELHRRVHAQIALRART